ncbi:probable terpene synthase 6 [Jatropha curcas]|uniref:probable terpene synthase 6 n=1 Tax=Jatropha curcas TaxID=180498 RepID=UPI001894A9D5|nr:probable terpene synthase 6 [Jatropha curcas]
MVIPEYESYTKKVESLKEKVRDMLMASTKNLIQNIELIDTLRRLGVSYHFEMEIEEQLNHIFYVVSKFLKDNDCDLYSIALLFRVLRQHGYKISCDVFNKFKDKGGKFKKAITDDVKGILSLYEASSVSVHGEDILDEALAFTKPIKPNLESSLSYAKSSLAMQSIPHHLAQHIRNALILSFHKGVPRVEVRQYISVYEEDESPNQTLLEFAKLDFNRVQLLHRQELGELVRWWKDSNLVEKLPYARDRIVELYFWACSMQSEPHFALLRLMVTKYLMMASLSDDTYDTYATMEEIIAFSDAFERCNISAIDQLPDYMKDLYKNILDLFEETSNIVCKEGRSYCAYYTKEAFKELLRAYRMEAKWSNDGYVPTFGEYLHNGATSSSYGVVPAVCFVGMGKFAGIKEYEWLKANPKIANAVKIIGRLLNDIVSHEDEQKRGNCASSVQCYKKEYGVTEEWQLKRYEKFVEMHGQTFNEEWMRPKMSIQGHP